MGSMGQSSADRSWLNPEAFVNFDGISHSEAWKRKKGERGGVQFSLDLRVSLRNLPQHS